MNRIIRVSSRACTFPKGVLFAQTSETTKNYHMFTGESLQGVYRILCVTDSNSSGKWYRTWHVEYAENVTVYMSYGTGIITHDPTVKPRKDNFSDEIKVLVERVDHARKWSEISSEFRTLVRLLFDKESLRLDENEKPI